jgi:hypothetical protein
MIDDLMALIHKHAVGVRSLLFRRGGHSMRRHVIHSWIESRRFYPNSGSELMGGSGGNSGV